MNRSKIWSRLAIAAITAASVSAARTHARAESVDMTPVPEETPVSRPIALPAITSKWSTQLYGFVEADFINDTTQSFNDLAGNGNIARSGTYAAEHGRAQFGVRNSRIGFNVNAPDAGSLKVSGKLEMDFFGNQPGNPGTQSAASGAATTPGLVSEAGFYGNPTFRVRHFFVKAENPALTVLAGQYWELFGWQDMFHPNTVDIQGIPGQIYSRAPQLRLSHMFASAAFNLDIAAAALRPPQRDSDRPDGQGGIRFIFNQWKGMRTAGGTGTRDDALQFGISAVKRRYVIPMFSTSSNPDTLRKDGWGLSYDAFIPVIPGTMKNRSNSLTITGSYVRGSGIADLYTSMPGPGEPSLSGGTYFPDVDSGLIVFDGTTSEKPRDAYTINWNSAMVGIQYYLPFGGNWWISANATRMDSTNAKGLAAESATTTKVYYNSRWADVNLFWDVSPAMRWGLEYAYFHQTYADGQGASDRRLQLSAFLLF